MYKNTNCFHLAIPCGDLEKAKKFYSETLGCRLDNADQEWADVDFWGNELTLHASEQKLDSERHDVDMGGGLARSPGARIWSSEHGTARRHSLAILSPSIASTKWAVSNSTAPGCGSAP